MFNPELGTISSRTNKISHLNNPGQEFNVNKIHRANNFLFNRAH